MSLVAPLSPGTRESFAREFGPRSRCCYSSRLSKDGFLFCELFLFQRKEPESDCESPLFLSFPGPNPLRFGSFLLRAISMKEQSWRLSLSNSRKNGGSVNRLLFLFLFRFSLLTTKMAGTFSKENWNKITAAIHEGVNNLGITTHISTCHYIIISLFHNRKLQIQSLPLTRSVSLWRNFLSL